MSSLLSRKTLLDVKEAFAIISREESHRGIASSSGSVPKPQISNFVSRTKFSNNNNNGNKIFDNKKVGHTIERCFDIIGYPPGYNRNSSRPGVKSTFTANAEVNQTNQTSTQSSPSLSLSNEQIMKLMSLINDTPSGSVQANMTVFDISDLNLTVRHPNGTLAKIKYVGNLQLSKDVVLYDVLVVPEYCGEIPLYMWNECVLTVVYLINKLPSSVLNGKSPFEMIYGTKPKLSHIRSFGCLCYLTVLNNSDKFSSSPYDEERATSNNEGSASNSPNTPISVSDPTDAGLNVPLTDVNDYVVNCSKKHGLEKVVNYSKLSSDRNWIDAMNTETEALNRNNTWTITTLPKGRKAIGSSGDTFVALLVYVDDIVITGSDIKQIDDFKHYLKKNIVLNHIESNEDKALTNVANYQKLIGKLIYLTHIRHDISYSVHCLSQHMHSLLVSHLKMALRVLRYLKGSPGCGVQVNKTENFGVKVYTDSDWARCPITRKSVSGFCVFLGDSLVSWKSKKQATLSRSSTEAEYRCMASATCEIIWICNVLSEFGIKNVFPA
ncbi:ribonuclease H-like domain-containing protein [Tanacetum coccineum]